jgi:N-acetylglutamate synthase-like GNAT family acetyltransferase
MSLSIRTAGREDLPSLQAVFRRSALSNDGDREALLEHPEHLVLQAEPVYDGRTRLAEDPGGDIVGFATLERSGDSAELVDLFVIPESMRRGVGRALVDDAVTTLAGEGISALWVTANPHAMAFYIAMGFESIGETATPLGPGTRMRLQVPSSAGPW